MYARQSFRSVLTGCVLAAAEGGFGLEVPPTLAASGRVRGGDVFLWPLMAVLWAFDVPSVAKRSLVVQWIRDAPTGPAMAEAFGQARLDLRQRGAIRDVEDLPSHRAMCPGYAHSPSPVLPVMEQKSGGCFLS